MRNWQIWLWVGMLAVVACNLPNRTMQTFDIQGHRGCRGLMPENTIPAFLYAVQLGCTTIELDVVVSQDGEVVVSHEPFLSHEFCSDPVGNAITADSEQVFNLYKMPYALIQSCDCGMRPHLRFPEQRKIPIYKPLLRDAIDSVEQYVTLQHKQPVWYNIEIKRVREQDTIFHPTVSIFIEKTLHIIRQKGILDRTILQCFDLETLQLVHQAEPHLATALLVEESQSKGIEADIKALGFVPTIYSPDFKLVDNATVAYAHRNGMRVIPWTVNKRSDMQDMIRLGVDGIITDYPDRLIELVKPALD